jgi:hypothetical protein
MSVTTTADEKIIEAREHIRVAHVKIMEVLNPDTWGYDQYSPEYIEDLHKCAMKIIEIKSLLG